MVLLQPFFRKDTYILCDNLYERHAGCVDTYCIFREMQKRGIPSYYVIWKENLFYRKLEESGELKNIIVLNHSVNKKYGRNYEFWYKVFTRLFRAKALLLSFRLNNAAIQRAFYSNKYIVFHQVGHACTYFKTFIFTNSYFDKEIYNRYACWNEAEAQMFVKYGKWERRNLPITGSCRCDQLKRIPHDRKTIFVMFTWRISFAPWSKDQFTIPLTQTKYYTRIRAFMHDPKFCQLIHDNNIRLLYSFHHSTLDQTVSVPDFKDLCGSIAEMVDPTDIASYIAISDLLITDYSSVFFDFSFLNIPTVFYRPDFDDETLTETDRNDMENVRTKDAELFNTFYDKDSAIGCVQRYVDNGFILEAENCRKLERFFPIRKNITDKFIRYLEDTYSIS